MTSFTDANGHTTTNVYEGGRVTSQTDEENRETTWEYLDNETRVTHPEGNVTAYEFEANQPTAVTEGFGTGLAATTTTAYNDEHLPETVTDPNTHTTEFGYDSAGNRTLIKDALNRETHMTYNARRDVTLLEAPSGKQTHYAYDGDGNLTSITRAHTETSTNQVIEMTYDANGQLTDLEDARNKVTQFDHNSQGDVISTIDPEGNESTATYDINSFMETATTPRGNELGATAAHFTTTYERDEAGRPTKITDGFGEFSTLVYDAKGNLTDVTDRDGRHTEYEYTYDVADQLTDVTYSSGTPGAVEFEYDADGRRVEMSDDTGTTTFDYDSLGRLVETENGAGQTTGYTYDIADRITDIDYPNALTPYDTVGHTGRSPVTTGTVQRGYDDANRLTSVTDWLTNTIDFGYDEDSNLTSIDRPNGVDTDYNYDRNGVLTGITGDPGGAWSYARSHDGLLNSRTRSSITDNFSYDPVARLTSDGHTYDNGDNLTATKDRAGTAVLQTFDFAHQLDDVKRASDSAALGSAGFNAQGDRTSYTPTTGTASSFAYDQADQLVSYSGPNRAGAGSASLEFSYDADGLRQTKTVGTTETNHAYDLTAGLPLMITDGPTAYITGPGGLPVEQIDSTGNEHYYHQDQLGSTMALTDDTGATDATFTYADYGHPGTPTGTARTPFGYAGQYTDPETGLQYLRARYYEPTTGQFLSRDPIEDQTGQPYSYADNDPINATDPTGLIASTLEGEGGIGAAIQGNIDPTCNFDDPSIQFGGFLSLLFGDPRDPAFVISILPWVRVSRVAGAGLRGVRATKGGTRTADAMLNAADGKVHGALPKPADLGKYDPEDLVRLRDELGQSVQKRIEKTVQLGADDGHSKRLAEEHALIRSIQKHLADR